MSVIAIIINNKARNASNVSSYLEGFKEANIAFKLYETDPDDLVSTIKQCMTKYKILLVGGGDGTIRTAAQCTVHTPTILGILPLGTLNHFAKELNLPQNATELIDSLTAQQTITIDIAEVNGLVFINNSSFGFYPKFVDKRDAYSKFYNKWLSYIPSFIESIKKHRVFNVDVKSKQLNIKLRTSFLMVSNNVYSFEFPTLFKRNSFQKSMLGLYYFKKGKLRIFKIIKGIFSKTGNFEINELDKPIQIEFKDQEEITISLDGETTKVKTPLHYKSVPQSLIILTKPL